MPFVPASDFGFSDYLANLLTQHPWQAGLLIPQGLSLLASLFLGSLSSLLPCRAWHPRVLPGWEYLEDLRVKIFA